MGRPRKEHNIAWIAEAAGVSVATVSNTMNNRHGVGEETRRKIQRIISGGVYQRSYRNVNPRTITVVTGVLGSWYMEDCLSGVVEYCSLAGVNLNTVLYNADNGKPLVEQLRINRCDGVVIFASGIGEADMRAVRAMKVPVILVDDVGEGVGYVNNDSYQGSFDLARHLLGLGHRGVAYLSYFVALPHQQNTLARIKGWQDAMRGAGASEENIGAWLRTARYEDIPGVVADLVAGSRGATALMVVDDHMALAVLHACHKLGLRVPEDVSVTGFDDVFDAQYYYPSLTTARHSAKEIARKAAAALDDVLSGRRDSLPQETVPAELVIRGSTGPAKTKSSGREK